MVNNVKDERNGVGFVLILLGKLKSSVMKIRNLFIGLALCLSLAGGAQAQVGKEMKAFRNKAGITVTMLTPSLYSLYRTTDSGLDAEELLRDVEEINVMQVRLKEAEEGTVQSVRERLSPVLDNEAKYTLVRSDEGAYSQERLYVMQRDGAVAALVLWSLDAETLSVVEVKGKIDLNQVGRIARVLNVKGLEKLAYVNAPVTGEPRSALGFTREGMADLWKELEERFGFNPDSMSMRDFFNGGGGMFDGMDEMFGNMEEFFNRMGEGFDMDSMFGGMGGAESFSNGLQVIRENGKTRIKVNAKNVDVRYMVDGVVLSADSSNQSIPEDIANVMMVSDPETPKTSYVVINTLTRTGQFVSFADGVLKYKYKNQEYTVNVEKLEEPAILLNNELTRDFSLDPSQIVQIRPVTEAERRLFRVPSAQVVIITDSSAMFGF